METFHDLNAKHAREHATATKAETVALHKKNATAAASVVRGLSDQQLARSATVLQGMPAMSVEQLIRGVLLRHIDEHIDSVRKTVGA
jgi:hypothetical protein